MNKYQLIESSSLWTGEELAEREDFLFSLEGSQLAEIKHLISGNLESAPNICSLINQVTDSLENGSGVIIIKNWPIHELSEDEAKRMFLNLVSIIGTPVSQSSEGEMIFSVKDSGFSDNDPRSRGPNTRKKLSFHSDRCDVIGFLCLQQAMSGGENQIVSSVAIHNHMLKNYPELLYVLYEPFYYKRHNVDTVNELPYCRQPIFSVTEGKFACNLLRVLIDRAYAMSEIPDMSDLQKTALDKIEEIASMKIMHHTYRQQPGDIILLNNWVTLHKRTEFVDHEKPEKKRHILRAWVSPSNNRAIDPLFKENYGDHRAGFVRGGMKADSKS
ncbi:MAG: hypothetical protein DBX02_02895 [Verrucomicrobia bacterium]|nr:MAG: hypothetical protein CBC36_04640 [Verrucomicrobiaceae bacterium TMED76]RCL31878.1 MAG: hypothetical protein DBX02_02895 [Verrucomicrobiota bacterium]